MRRDRTEQEVAIPCEGIELAGLLGAGEASRQVVVFADPDGSHQKERNRKVAAALHGRGIATFLIDLLTAEEEQADGETGRHRFDIDLLSRRLVAATDWLAADKGYTLGSIGCLGSDTGAAAALMAATRRPALVGAVVSRGGRPDLVPTEILQAVRAPTLLIVGGFDDEGLRLNRAVLAKFRCEAALKIVPEATRHFEDSDALARVADLAGDWFHENLWEIWPRSADQLANI
jgi:putative phosphoribosyl transferase